VHGGLAVVGPVGDVLEERVDLLAGDIADVVDRRLAEDEPTILPLIRAGPPLLPGLIAASI
jgi:hypothetical protein